MKFPSAAAQLIDPDPPRLSELSAGLRAIEARGIYSNYGPVNTELETALALDVFAGGHALTVSSATVGLMMALKQAAVRRPGRRFALMPSFTFAATAQAALWAGLTPLLCDIDPVTWCASSDSEDALPALHGEAVAAVVPCATFGYPVDAARYDAMAGRWGCAVVMDAAAALGTRRGGRHLVAGSGVSVFSMHVTKAFSTSEGGVVHGFDADQMAELRAMGNFGFEAGRLATLPGLNSKLPEVTALLGLGQVPRLPGVVADRMRLLAAYRRHLPGEFALQPPTGEDMALMSLALTVPRALIPHRPEIVRALEAIGVASLPYYSPHLAEHPFIAAQSEAGPLPISKDVADRVLCLPLHARMDEDGVAWVVRALLQVVAAL